MVPISPSACSSSFAGTSEAASIIMPALRPSTPADFRKKLLDWKAQIDRTRCIPHDDFFPTSNEKTASFLDPMWNIDKMLQVSHSHQNNIVIGVGGLFNLDIVLARMKANPGSNYFLLVVDINDAYAEYWKGVFDAIRDNPSLDQGRAAINRVIMMHGGLWGGESSYNSFLYAGQEIYDLARKLVLEERALFSTLDMFSIEDAKKLREIIDSLGYFVDTYNVSNVAAVSNLSSALEPGAVGLSASCGELLMPGSWLVASRIYHSGFIEDGQEFRSGDGQCVQSLIAFKDPGELPAMLANPQRYENPDWFCQDIAMLFKHEGIPDHEVVEVVFNAAGKYPRELTVPMFKEIFQFYVSDENPRPGILAVIERLLNDKYSLRSEIENYKLALRIAIQEMERSLGLPEAQKSRLGELKQKLAVLLP